MAPGINMTNAWCPHCCEPTILRPRKKCQWCDARVESFDHTMNYALAVTTLFHAETTPIPEPKDRPQ